jgi:excisionase family DNA binding protein
MAGVDVPRDPALEPLEPLMSLEEVGRVLRISERGVYRLLASGELPSLKVGQRTLVEPGQLRQFIATRRRQCAAPHEE